jgi:hypothetical protein
MSKILVPSKGESAMDAGTLASLGNMAKRAPGPADYSKLEPAFFNDRPRTYGEGLSLIRKAGYDRYLTPAEAMCFSMDVHAGIGLQGAWDEIRKEVEHRSIWVSSVCWRREGRLEIYEGPETLGFRRKGKDGPQGYCFVGAGQPAPAASFPEPSGDIFSLIYVPEDVSGYLFKGMPEDLFDVLSNQLVFIPKRTVPVPMQMSLDLYSPFFLGGDAFFLSRVLGVREKR